MAGLPIQGSQMQDSVIWMKDNHRQNHSSGVGPWPPPSDNVSTNTTATTSGHLRIIAVSWSSTFYLLIGSFDTSAILNKNSFVLRSRSSSVPTSIYLLSDSLWRSSGRGVSSFSLLVGLVRSQHFHDFSFIILQLYLFSMAPKNTTNIFVEFLHLHCQEFLSTEIPNVCFVTSLGRGQ